MTIVPFDDQHQPMSTWLDELATKEANDANLIDDENTQTSRNVKYAGIDSTWNQKTNNHRSQTTGNQNRKFHNRHRIAASVEEIEVTARKSLMSGDTIDKMSTNLKKTYHKNDVNSFLSKRLSKVEKEFGKLGYIYVDPMLVDDCHDMMKITKQKVASIALRNVKKSKKCDDCQFNKRANCLLTGLKIADNHAVTANEAKFILNKFASLKYVNKLFVKAADMTSYYDRLKSDVPETVISDFLVDVDKRRCATEKFNLQKIKTKRVAAKHKADVTTLKNKKAKVKWGSTDTEISDGFKRLLLKQPSIRTAKRELVKHYGSDRVTTFMKESKIELRNFIRFLSRKKEATVLRIKSDANNVSDKSMTKAATVTYDKDKINDVNIKRALDIIYSGFLHNEVVADTKKKLIRAFDSSTVDAALNKFKTNAGSKRQAYALVKHAIDRNLIDKKAAKKIASTFKNENDLKSIREAIVNDRRRLKKISKAYQDRIISAAVKFAKKDSIVAIEKLSAQRWSGTKKLIEKLSAHVSDVKKFSNALQPIVNKTASDANAMLAQSNHCSINILSDDDVKQSDVTLFNTI